jgi:RNA recognition motif-containing protein
MNRLTPQREAAIRAKQFFGIAKKFIEELLYEIDELRIDIYDLQHGTFEEHEEENQNDDSHPSVYEDFQEKQKDRDKVKTILTTEVKENAVQKFFSKSGER